MSWLRRFTLVCIAVLVAVALALAALLAFVDLGLSGHGMAALFIGAILSVALSMILMGLLFASHRHGHDAAMESRSRPGEPPGWGGRGQ